MKNIIVVTLSDHISFASVRDLMRIIEMWRGVQKVEFKDAAQQKDALKRIEELEAERTRYNVVK